MTIKLKSEKEGGLPFWKAAYEIEMAIPEISIIQPDDLVTKVETNLSGTLGTMKFASFIIWPVTLRIFLKQAFHHRVIIVSQVVYNFRTNHINANNISP